MRLSSRFAFATVVAIAVFCIACETTDLISPLGTITFAVSGSLVPQVSDTHGNQIATWNLEVVEIEVPDEPLFDYLELVPCEVVENISLFVTLASQCGVVGYVLNEGSYIATVRLTLNAMRVYRASRPPLPPDGDHDMDGILNDSDNCVLIPNGPLAGTCTAGFVGADCAADADCGAVDGVCSLDQEDTDDVGIGDVCRITDDISGVTFKDTDADEIVDLIDNCVWVANPGQEDTDTGTLLRGIGDACEESAPVTLPDVPQEFEFLLDFPAQGSDVIVVIVDFDTNPDSTDPAVTCDPSYTICTLNPAAVTIRFG